MGMTAMVPPDSDRTGFEAPSPASGILSEITAKEGDNVAPGGIPAKHILLEPRTNSYSPPNVSLKETIVHGDAPTLALRIQQHAHQLVRQAAVEVPALGDVDRRGRGGAGA